jgi:Tfp pilus assembly protein PilW
VVSPCRFVIHTQPTTALIRDQRGITLIELLVGVMIMLILFGAVISLMITTFQAQPRIAERNASIQEGRVLQERLTRELRLAYGVQSASASSLTFDTFLHRATCGGAASDTATAIQCRVTYSCSSGSCTRAEGPVGGAALDVDTLVTGISNSGSVFSYQPVSSPVTSIGFVGVTLGFPAEEAGEDAITLEDGAALRNQ